MVRSRSLDRWIALEIGRINAGLVVEKKNLARLRAEARPTLRTREGQEIVVARDALERLARVVPSNEQERLRLPMTLFVSGDLEDSTYLTDELAAKALRSAEAYGAAFPFRDGRMYLPHSLAIDLIRRYGGAVQIAYG